MIKYLKKSTIGDKVMILVFISFLILGASIFSGVGSETPIPLYNTFFGARDELLPTSSDGQVFRNENALNIENPLRSSERAFAARTGALDVSRHNFAQGELGIIIKIEITNAGSTIINDWRLVPGYFSESDVIHFEIQELEPLQPRETLEIILTSQGNINDLRWLGFSFETRGSAVTNPLEPIRVTLVAP